jgi:hypothetical protein
MCDYSLHGLPSRLAVQGEELVARRFCTSTIGLASPAELGRFIGSASDRKGHWWSLISAETLPQVASEAPAVCVPPGAQLRLSDIGLILQSELGVGPIETVIFTQTDAASGTYHDAVQFANRRRILLQVLQVLKEGQRVRVLALVSGDAGQSDFVNKSTDSERLISRLPLFATSEVKQSLYLRRRAARSLAE